MANTIIKPNDFIFMDCDLNQEDVCASVDVDLLLCIYDTVLTYYDALNLFTCAPNCDVLEDYLVVIFSEIIHHCSDKYTHEAVSSYIDDKLCSWLVAIVLNDYSFAKSLHLDYVPRRLESIVLYNYEGLGLDAAIKDCGLDIGAVQLTVLLADNDDGTIKMKFKLIPKDSITDEGFRDISKLEDAWDNTYEADELDSDIAIFIEALKEVIDVKLKED